MFAIDYKLIDIDVLGNGYIGTVVENNARLYLKHARAMSIELNYYPLAVFHMEGLETQGTIISVWRRLDFVCLQMWEHELILTTFDVTKHH